MSRWAITKNVLARALEGRKDGRTAWQMLTETKKERVDKDFPLNLRIHARVNLDKTDYLLAEKYLAMSEPVSVGTIVEIGVITHSEGLVDYLARIAPDHATEEDLMSILLVETRRNEVLAATLFTLALELYPDSTDEIDVWLNDEDGILGGRELKSPDGDIYYRVWGDGERVEPMSAAEEVFTDKYGDHIENNGLIQMMYAREIRDDSGRKLTDEYALVSYVNEECVEILLGVSVIVKDGDIIG